MASSEDEILALLQRLQSAGGGSNSGGMETRIARLEVRADGIENRLDDIKADIRRVESKLLTKWDVAQVVFFVMATLMAAVAFGPRVVALISP